MGLLPRADPLPGAAGGVYSGAAPLASPERPGPSSRPSEGSTVSCTHPVGHSGWQRLPDKAPAIGPGCPVALPDSPRGKVVWRPLASGCVHVGKTLGTGRPGCCWASAGCVSWVCPVLGPPLRLITLMLLLGETCPVVGPQVWSLSLAAIPPHACRRTPTPLHTGRDSGSETSPLAQDRVGPQTRPAQGPRHPLRPRPRPAPPPRTGLSWHGVLVAGGDVLRTHGVRWFPGRPAHSSSEAGAPAHLTLDNRGQSGLVTGSETASNPVRPPQRQDVTVPQAQRKRS